MALITKARKKIPPLAQNMFSVQSTTCRQIIECGRVYVSLWKNKNFLCNTSYCVLIFESLLGFVFQTQREKKKKRTVLTPHFHLHTFYAQWRTTALPTA